MMDWFDNLAPRERLILGTGAALAVIIIVWGFVWSPLRDSSAELREAVADKTQLVIDIRRAEGLGQQTSNDGPVSGQSLAVLVEDTSQSLGLPRFTRTRPQGPNAINVSFQATPFHLLTNWLIDIEQNHGVGIDSLSATQTREPGLVNGQILLRRN